MKLLRKRGAHAESGMGVRDAPTAARPFEAALEPGVMRPASTRAARLAVRPPRTLVGWTLSGVLGEDGTSGGSVFRRFSGLGEACNGERSVARGYLVNCYPVAPWSVPSCTWELISGISLTGDCREKRCFHPTETACARSFRFSTSSLTLTTSSSSEDAWISSLSSVIPAWPAYPIPTPTSYDGVTTSSSSSMSLLPVAQPDRVFMSG